MKIVIEISEEDYKLIKSYGKGSTNYRISLNLYDAVKNGTPLPKHHGDLIDRSKIGKAIPAEEDNCTGMGMSYDEMDAYNEGIDIMYSRIQYAPTIIEAERSDNE